MWMGELPRPNSGTSGLSPFVSCSAFKQLLYLWGIPQPWSPHPPQSVRYSDQVANHMALISICRESLFLPTGARAYFPAIESGHESCLGAQRWGTERSGHFHSYHRGPCAVLWGRLSWAPWRGGLVRARTSQKDQLPIIWVSSHRPSRPIESGHTARKIQ